MTQLKALVLNCTLTPSPENSSTELLGTQLLDALGEHGVDGELVRVVDHGVRFGISNDEGGGDGWPAIRAKVLDADIVVVASPVWMGQPSSVTKMVLERLDAELSETDDAGRMTTYDKVGLVAVVGNEDGAHHVSAEVYQGLNDTAFSLPPNAVTYWVGQAMQGTDYQDLDETPEETDGTTRTDSGPQRGPPRPTAEERAIPRRVSGASIRRPRRSTSWGRSSPAARTPTRNRAPARRVARARPGIAVVAGPTE